MLKKSYLVMITLLAMAVLVLMSATVASSGRSISEFKAEAMELKAEAKGEIMELYDDFAEETHGLMDMEELAGLKAELNEDIADVKEDLKNDLMDLKADLKGEFMDLKDDLKEFLM